MRSRNGDKNAKRPVCGAAVFLSSESELQGKPLDFTSSHTISLVCNMYSGFSYMPSRAWRAWGSACRVFKCWVGLKGCLWRHSPFPSPAGANVCVLSRHQQERMRCLRQHLGQFRTRMLMWSFVFVDRVRQSSSYAEDVWRCREKHSPKPKTYSP